MRRCQVLPLLLSSLLYADAQSTVGPDRENVTTPGFFMEPEPSPGGLNVTAGEAITIVIGCLVVLGSSISLLRYALVRSPRRPRVAQRNQELAVPPAFM